MPSIVRQWSQFEPQNPDFFFNRTLPIFQGCISFGIVWDGRPYDFINAIQLGGTGTVGNTIRTYGRYATISSGASDGWYIPINTTANISSVATGSIFAAHYCTVSNTTLKRVVRASNSTSGSILTLSAGDGTFNSIIGSAQATGPVFPSSRSSLTPAANTPYSTLFTRNGNTHRLYIDGASVTRTDVNLYHNNFIADINQIYVGTSGGSHPLTGGVLSWGVWNRTLTADEAQFLHQAVTLNDWKELGLIPRRIWVPMSQGGSSTYTFSVSGGVTFAGTAPNLRTRIQVPSDGVNFGGTAPVTDTSEYQFNVSGGITFSGAPVIIQENVIAPNGGASFGGSARLIFVPVGGAGNNDSDRISVGVSRKVGVS